MPASLAPPRPHTGPLSANKARGWQYPEQSAVPGRCSKGVPTQGQRPEPPSPAHSFGEGGALSRSALSAGKFCSETWCSAGPGASASRLETEGELGLPEGDCSYHRWSHCLHGLQGKRQVLPLPLAPRDLPSHTPPSLPGPFSNRGTQASTPSGACDSLPPAASPSVPGMLTPCCTSPRHAALPARACGGAGAGSRSVRMEKVVCRTSHGHRRGFHEVRPCIICHHPTCCRRRGASWGRSRPYSWAVVPLNQP